MTPKPPDTFDPLNVVLMAIGAAGFFALWWYGILSADVIWKILTAEI
jgi:hypothetical protein